MPTINDLEKSTEEFFKLYQFDSFSHPSWSKVNQLLDGNWVNSIYQQDAPGCYALLRGDEVVYIGVGIRGNEEYPYHGIGLRIKDHKSKGKLKDKTGYLTLAFHVKHRHIALALEAFLIEKCSPSDNTTGLKY